jgi:hypothetical protein
LPSDNLSFGDLLPEIITKPFEAILHSNWQQRLDIPVFPGFSDNKEVGLFGDLGFPQQHNPSETVFTDLICSNAVISLQKRLELIEKLSKGFLIEPAFKNTVLHSLAVILQGVGYFISLLVIGDVIRDHHVTHLVLHKRFVFLFVEHRPLHSCHLSSEEPAIAGMGPAFPIKKRLLHALFIKSKKFVKGFFIQGKGPTALPMEVCFFDASLVYERQHQPINYRVAEFLYHIQGKGLPAVS